jgi:hypothetical protein
LERRIAEFLIDYELGLPAIAMPISAHRLAGSASGFG